MTKRTLNQDQVSNVLKEHIICGDRGDGVPNFLSADNVLVEKIRQSPISKKKLAVWLTQEPETFCDKQQLDNYTRNEVLIDLSQIPDPISAAILEAFDQPILGHKRNLYGYFVKHRMKGLLDVITDF